MINTVPAGAGPEGISTGLRRGTTARSDMDSLPCQREVQVEGGSLPGFALDPDLSRMLLDDAVGDAQTETSAAVLTVSRRRFSGKEGIVNTGDVLLSDAAPRIRNHDANSRSVQGGDAQGSALGHCVLRVEEQVEKYLLQTPCVASNRWKMVAEFVLNFDS